MELLKTILEWGKDHKAVVVAAALMILINIFIDTDWVSEHLSFVNFYHQGWIEHNRQWMIPLIGVAIASIYFAWHRLGFAIILIACIGLGIFFALTYGNPALDGDWPVVWLAYRTTLALLVGLVARVADFIANL